MSTHNVKCGFFFWYEKCGYKGGGCLVEDVRLKVLFVEDDDIVEWRTTTTYGTTFCDACVDESLLRLIASNAYLFLNCYSCVRYRKA